MEPDNSTTEEESHQTDNVSADKPQDISAPEAPAAKERSSALAANNDDTSRVDLRIGSLNDKAVVEGDTTHLTFEQIENVVDLDISGATYKLDNPSLLVKVPKTKKIQNLTFTKSEVAKETKKWEDDDFYYYQFFFTNLTGGMRLTYTLKFQFDGHTAVNGDTIKVEAQLLDSAGKEVTKATKTFTAKTVPFAVYSSEGISGLSSKKTDAVDGVAIPEGNPAGLVPNGHRMESTMEVDDPTSPTAPPLGKYSSRAGRRTNVFFSFYPNTPAGTPGLAGIAYPKNAKVVVTLPAGVVVPRLNEGVTIEKRSDGSSVVTYRVDNPQFDSVNLSHVLPHTNNRAAVLAKISGDSQILVDFSDVALNTDLPITADFYVNTNADGSGGEYIGSRNETFFFKPVAFKQSPGILSMSRNSDFTLFMDLPGNIDTNAQIYSYGNKRIFVGSIDRTDAGMGIETSVCNSNNGGSSSDPYSGGAASFIKEIEFIPSEDNASGLFYKSFKFLEVRNCGDFWPNDLWSPHLQKFIDAVNNNDNTSLYGVTADGDEELIQKGVKYGQEVQINDTERKYAKLVLHFADPVEFNNDYAVFREYLGLTDAETQRLDALSQGSTLKYESWAVAWTKDHKSVTTRDGYQYRSDLYVGPVTPVVDEYLNKDTSVPNSNESKEFTLKVGPFLPVANGYAGAGDPYRVYSAYGTLKEIKKMRTVTLLPAGINYKGWEKADVGKTFGKNPETNKPWETWEGLKEPQVRFVSNYQNTGQDAVVIDYGDVPVGQRMPINLKLEASKYAAPGKSNIPTYMSWDDNDYIRPYKYDPNAENKGPNTYVDALDIDGDGNTSELFMVRWSTVDYTPPRELQMTDFTAFGDATDQSQKLSYSMATVGDIGYPAALQLKIYNNSLNDVQSLSLIDVLPYKGDHTIVANSEGTYSGRESTFSMPLTSSIEDANTSKVNKKFEFFYQLTPQGADLASVRDGEWLTASDITDRGLDWGLVKSFKVVLRERQSIKSQSDESIIIPVKVPFDKTLTDEDVAHNSAAFSVNGGTDYTEANVTATRVAPYKVEGRYFFDKDKDGIYDKSKGDVPLAGRTLTLVKAGLAGTSSTGVPGKVTNPDGSEIELVTDADGWYSATVYGRGDYRIHATKNNYEDFVTTTSDEEEGNNLDLSTATSNAATTTALALSPIARTARRNIAVTATIGSITVEKTAADEVDNTNKGKALAGAEFALQDVNGNPATDISGKVVANQTTDAKGKLSFSNLLLGSYKVVEVTAPAGYTVADAQNVTLTTDAPNGTLAFKDSLARTSIPVTKIWSDTNNQDGTRPESVSFTLIRNGKATDTKLTLTKAKNADAQDPNTWKGAFTNLPATTTADETVDGKTIPAGTAISYGVEEDAISASAGYTATTSGSVTEGFTVTNTRTPDTVSVDVTKTWVGILPETASPVTVRLLANGKDTGKTQELTSDNAWSASFSDLAKNEAGKAITYTVVEDGASNGKITLAGIDYTVAVKEENSSGNRSSWSVTNTMTNPEVTVPVKKAWSDTNNQDGKQTASVEVSLVAQVGETKLTDLKDLEGHAISNLTLDKDNDWQASFSKLPTYTNKGEKISYSIKEENVPAGYKDTVEINDEGVYILTNSHELETINVPVKKVWVDNNNAKGLRPQAIKLTLYADGVATDKTLTLDEANNWSASFDKLLKYKQGSQGQEIVYTVVEDKVDNYSASYTGDNTALTVTNTLVGKVSVGVTKTWVGINKEAAPSVEVQLYADGKAQGAPIALTNEGEWKHSFEGLDQYTAAGKEIAYTLQEVGVDANNKLEAAGHSYSVDIQNPSTHSWVITNTLDNPPQDIVVNKVWQDHNNQDNKRPDTIVIRLLADGVEQAHETLSTDKQHNNQSHTFKDLPTYNNKGEKIVYTVQEDAVDGYTTKLDQNTLTITNTHELETIAVPVTKTWKDNNNALGLRPNKVVVELLADGTPTNNTLELTADNNWSASFEGLVAYRANKTGERVVYTVREQPMEKVGTSEYYTQTENKNVGTTEAPAYNITNTLEGKIDINVAKVWEGINKEAAPAVEVQLYANGQKHGAPLTLNRDNDWKLVYKGLDQFKDGQKIVYTLEEVGTKSQDLADGTHTLVYQAKDGHSYNTSIDHTDDGYTWTVTNTLINPKMTIKGKKVWQDQDNKDASRPQDIIVTLLENGKPTDKTQKVTSSSDGSFSFEDLPSYDMDGKAIVYTVDELEVPQGYEKKVEGSAESGFTITNSHTPKPTQTPKPVQAMPKTGDTSLGVALPSVAAIGLLALGAALRMGRRLTKKQDE